MLDEIYMGPDYAQKVLDFAVEYRKHKPDAKLSEVEDHYRAKVKSETPIPLHTKDSAAFLDNHPVTAFAATSAVDLVEDFVSVRQEQLAKDIRREFGDSSANGR